MTETQMEVLQIILIFAPILTGTIWTITYFILKAKHEET